jgi:hypothetical protein
MLESIMLNDFCCFDLGRVGSSASSLLKDENIVDVLIGDPKASMSVMRPGETEARVRYVG